MAAFIDGALDASSVRTIAEHIATCDECIAEIGEAGMFAEPHAPGGVHDERRWAETVSAAAVAVIVMLSLWAMLPRSSAASYTRLIDPLVRAAAEAERPVEPRLAGGFAWSRARVQPRGSAPAADPGQVLLESAAGEVLEQAAAERSPEALHASAVAYLFVGRYDTSIALLQAAIREAPGDASLWNDLAAAVYVASRKRAENHHLRTALAAADRALRIDPAMPEALFNRALILDAAGPPDAARRAWMQYLAVDGSSSWSAEVQDKLEERP